MEQIFFEAWRAAVFILASLTLSALVRIYLERIGKKKRRLDRSSASPTLALVNIGGIAYITLDTLRNFGRSSFNWFETPLATIILGTGSYLYWRTMYHNHNHA